MVLFLLTPSKTTERDCFIMTGKFPLLLSPGVLYQSYNNYMLHGNRKMTVFSILKLL